LATCQEQLILLCRPIVAFVHTAIAVSYMEAKTSEEWRQHTSAHILNCGCSLVLVQTFCHFWNLTE